jgi:hypothetical protein
MEEWWVRVGMGPYKKASCLEVENICIVHVHENVNKHLNVLCCVRSSALGKGQYNDIIVTNSSTKTLRMKSEKQQA